MSLPRHLPLVLCLALVSVAAAQPPLQLVPATDGSCVGVASKNGQPLYFPGGNGLAAVSLPQTPAQEGTLSFFFTPDWSPGDCTTHWLCELKGEGFLLAFRKGYNHAISPEYCYLFTDPEGGMAGFHCENLFRAREKHHYAIRWSNAKGRVQFVVDGEASGRSGKFKFTGPVTIPATLTLYNMAGGTFEDIRVYPKFLSVPEITTLAGRKQPAQYLQEQPPPPRGGAALQPAQRGGAALQPAQRRGAALQPAQRGGAALQPAQQGAAPQGPAEARPLQPHAREYVDPATGKLVQTLEDDQKELLPPYNPADYADLPVTPHTKWARPLAAGKLRILFVATHGFYDEYSMIREAAELWQRLDCDIQVTNQPDPRVMSQEFDVIAVSLQGFTNGRWAGWADLDAKLREWIVAQVKDGKSGLVWSYPIAPDSAMDSLFAAATKQPTEELLRGFPTTALPQANSKDGAFRWDKVYDLDESFFLTPADAEKLVEVHRVAATVPVAAGGRDAHPTRRLVKLNYNNASWHPNMGLTADSALNAAATDVQYDAWMALAARAMLLAAGREQPVRIVSADVSGATWPVTLTGNVVGMKLSVRARDVWGREAMKPAILPAAQTLTIKGVKLAPRTSVDLILRDAQGNAVDWFIATPPLPTDPHITGIKLDREYYQPGQTVQATLTVQATHPEQCTVELFLTDHEGRRLRRSITESKVLGGPAAAISRVVLPASADSLLMRVEADLKVNGVLADTRSADVPVPQMTPRGFYALLYGTPLNRLCERTRHRLFRDQFGVRGGFHQGSHSWANLAALNLTCIEYSGHLGYPQKQSDCEDFAENWEQNVAKWLLGPPEKMPPYRPIFYSLGEEHFVLMSACPTPTANAKFRDWLKGKYGTLERLNAVWFGVTLSAAKGLDPSTPAAQAPQDDKVAKPFKSWDDISMMTPEIVDMLKIQFDVVRFENRRFMEHLFADRHAFLAEYLRKATTAGTDAPGRTGIHAGWDLWMGRGYDYWLLSRGMEDMMCYGGPHNHVARSFFERYYGSHYHYNIGSQENVRWHPWYMLLSGAHGFSWYTDAPQIWGATMSDLHLTSDWTAAQDEFKAVTDAGELLTRAHYQDDQIAIHYSQDSFQVGVSDLTWMHQRFINLCFDTGTPFRFVSYAQVERGDLLKRTPKVLVLPHSLALSEAECRGLRDYVQSGGVLWADVVPGTYNNFGQHLAQSQLADLFTGLEEAKLETGGTVARKAVGKGWVVLADPGNFSYDRNVGRYLGATEMMARVSDLAGVQSVADVTNAGDGKPANGLWTAGWTNGTARHVAVCKDYELADQTDVPARVTFPQAGHVYEGRSGKYLGKAATVAATLRPTTGQVFTVLPYRVKAISLGTINRAATRGQDLVLSAALQTEGAVGKDDLNVLQVRVTDPQGREVTALRRTVEMRGGKGQIALPLALNDAAGKWTVTVRDLATGVTARTSWQLGG